MDIKKLNEELDEMLSNIELDNNKKSLKEYEADSEDDEEFVATMEEYELYVLEEIKPIADKLNKLLSLLRDIGADERADSLADVLDYLDI